MRRQISSAQTFLMKVVFPLLWIGSFSVVTFLLFTDRLQDKGTPVPAALKWVFLVATIIGSVVIARLCVGLKRVELDDQMLYASNFRDEIAVPLRDVTEVTENRWVNPHRVTLHLARDTEFGDRIMFMPTVRWFERWTSHPIVAELRTAVAQARGLPLPPTGTS
jgi:hypothetical protein